MARLTKRKFLDITPSQIGKMKVPELRELLRGARQLYNNQSKAFKKYDSTVYSQAYDKMETYYEETGKKAPSRMNLNQMRQEVFRLEEFFDSKTATVPGARQVAADVNRRIFGEDKRGRPNYRMSIDESKRLWAIYEEFKKMRPQDVFDQSTLVQQYLGQMLIHGNQLDFNAENMTKLANLVDNAGKRASGEMDVNYDGSSTVLSGTRPY